MKMVYIYQSGMVEFLTSDSGKVELNRFSCKLLNNKESVHLCLKLILCSQIFQASIPRLIPFFSVQHLFKLCRQVTLRQWSEFFLCMGLPKSYGSLQPGTVQVKHLWNITGHQIDRLVLGVNLVVFFPIPKNEWRLNTETLLVYYGLYGLLLNKLPVSWYYATW